MVERTRKTRAYKALVVLFLLAILIGGSTAISITVTEIMLVVAIAIIVGLVIFSIIGSWTNRKKQKIRP